jgi:ketosteroid isomerase-like protein
LFLTLGLVLGIQSVSGQSADEEALTARFAAYNEALAGGTPEQVTEFYAENAVRLAPDEAAVVGTDALKAAFAASQAEYDYSLDEYQVRRVVVDGDLGHILATYTETATPKAGGASETQSGRWAVMWARQDGTWKITAEIWNLEPPN